MKYLRDIIFVVGLLMLGGGIGSQIPWLGVSVTGAILLILAAGTMLNGNT